MNLIAANYDTLRATDVLLSRTIYTTDTSKYIAKKTVNTAQQCIAYLIYTSSVVLRTHFRVRMSHIRNRLTK
jgi:hypothetical protein